MDFKYVAAPWETEPSLDASLLCYLLAPHPPRVAASRSAPQTPATANLCLCLPQLPKFPWLFPSLYEQAEVGEGCHGGIAPGS